MKTESRALPPGVVVFVDGMSSSRSDYLAVTLESRYWYLVAPRVVKDETNELITQNVHLQFLRVLGERMAEPTGLSSKTFEPVTRTVETFSFRDSNYLRPVHQPKDIEGLKHFRFILSRLNNITQNKYLESVIFDLNILVSYLDLSYKNRRLALNPYSEKLIAIFEGGIPL